MKVYAIYVNVIGTSSSINGYLGISETLNADELPQKKKVRVFRYTWFRKEDAETWCSQQVEHYIDVNFVSKKTSEISIEEVDEPEKRAGTHPQPGDCGRRTFRGRETTVVPYSDGLPQIVKDSIEKDIPCFDQNGEQYKLPATR